MSVGLCNAESQITSPYNVPTLCSKSRLHIACVLPQPNALEGFYFSESGLCLFIMRGENFTSEKQPLLLSPVALRTSSLSGPSGAQMRAGFTVKQAGDGGHGSPQLC